VWDHTRPIAGHLTITSEKNRGVTGNIFNLNWGGVKIGLSLGVKFRLSFPTPLRSGVTADEAMSTIVGAADQHYTAMLRFRLVDKERRVFVAERFYFRGAIDDWIFLGGPDDSKKLAGRYIRLLGTATFFDSPYF